MLMLDSGETVQLGAYLSGMDWKYFDDRSSGWASLTVGNGLPGAMLFGNDSSIAGGGTAGV